MLPLNERKIKLDALLAPRFSNELLCPTGGGTRPSARCGSDAPFSERALMATDALVGMEISRSPEGVNRTV